jgi:hypothetical protein
VERCYQCRRWIEKNDELRTARVGPQREREFLCAQCYSRQGCTFGIVAFLIGFILLLILVVYVVACVAMGVRLPFFRNIWP